MIFEFIVLGLAVAHAVIAPLTYWKIMGWYDFYIPIVIFIGTYILGLLLVIVFLLFAGLFSKWLLKKYPHNKLFTYRARFFLKQALILINIHCNVSVRDKGLGKIPRNERFLLVCNHISNFDPMVTINHLTRYEVDFITKPENMKIPVAGNFLQALNFLAINREDRMQSLQVMQEAIKLISEDICSIGVYPEGTRGHKKEMLPFHEGVFTIALKAHCPIVIVTVKNTDKIRKRAPFKHTTVYHDIVNVIPYEEIEGQTPKAVSDLVRSIMENNLRRYERNG